MSEKPELTPLQQAALSRKFLEANVVSRAWSDQAFQESLKSNPAAALAEAGAPAPDGVSVRVVFEEPGTIHLVLPPKPAVNAEASDTELEAVAGGGIINTGKCESWENIDRGRREGKLDSTQELVFKGAVALTALVGISWGWA